MTANASLTPLLVTAAIIAADGRYLATQRPMHKTHPLLWEFPGGKIEPGEAPELALSRELREELAIEIRVETIFEVIYHCYDWGPVLILAYRCSWLSGEITHLEVADHYWGTPQELLRLPFLPADRPLLKRLQQP